MLESEWKRCRDVGELLTFLRLKGLATERKLRLFAVACCRHLAQRVPVDNNHLAALDVAERFADGKASAAELGAPFAGSQHLPNDQRTASIACMNVTEMGDTILMADCAAGNAAWAGAEHAAACTGLAPNSPGFTAALEAEKVAQASILRDLFGPLPFRHVSLSSDAGLPSPLSLVELAKSIYEEGTFAPERMVALGNSLAKAHGDDEVISHCKSENEKHVRGCWVVDLVLGKR